MRLYGFMQDEKFYEDLGHIAIGFFLPFFGWWREHRQWPPGEILRYGDDVCHCGDLMNDHRGMSHNHSPVEMTMEVAPLDRVADSYRDFLGYAIGDVLRTATLVGLLIWRW